MGLRPFPVSMGIKKMRISEKNGKTLMILATLPAWLLFHGCESKATPAPEAKSDTTGSTGTTGASSTGTTGGSSETGTTGGTEKAKAPKAPVEAGAK